MWNRFFIIGLFCCPFFFVTFSQSGYHIDGGHFSKLIEYNLNMRDSLFNFNSKDPVERIFFNKYNAPVEFYCDYRSEVLSGFRINRESDKMPYLLEVKYVTNIVEAQGKARNKYPTPMLSDMNEQQRSDWFKIYFEERNKHLIIEGHTITVSEQFAENIYKKMVALIGNFKARGVPPIVVHGYTVTFRNVVEDEIWSLKIQIPNGNALKMSDLCRQITEDAINKKLDEASYIKLLDEFNF